MSKTKVNEKLRPTNTDGRRGSLFNEERAEETNVVLDFRNMRKRISNSSLNKEAVSSAGKFNGNNTINNFNRLIPELKMKKLQIAEPGTNTQVQSRMAKRDKSHLI